MSSDYYRNKLIRTFHLAAREAGLTDENKKEYVNSIYSGKTLSALTLDELQKVTQGLIRKTGVDVTMPRKPGRNLSGKRKQVQAPKLKNPYSRSEPATSAQLNKIDMLTQKLGLNDTAVRALYLEMGWFGGIISKIVAIKVTEALKVMDARGWRPKYPDTIKPADKVTNH